ncbi:MAG: ABC transporter permease, partial [Nitrospirae bacterium]
LHYIFRITHPAGLIVIFFFMCLFASLTAHHRMYLGKIGFAIAFFSITLSSAIVLTSMMFFRIISMRPNEIIPLGGMIIGNSLNIYTLTIDRLKGEVKNTIDLIESRIALGATLKEALKLPSRAAIKAAFIPILNSLQTVGIIHIPGITTGMILAGAPPLRAVSYQIAIMYMLVSVALFTGYFSILLASRRSIFGGIIEG